jgi:hypothetical protein
MIVKVSWVVCAIAVTLWMVVSEARAGCEEVWGPYRDERPDITCTPLTDEILVSLEGATRSQVIKVMGSSGRPLKDKDTIHFVGASDHNSGDVNFAFEGDLVVRIFGFRDSGENFLWKRGEGKAIRYYK